MVGLDFPTILLYNSMMRHLHVIIDINDPLTQLIKDDPVRPEIPVEQRISNTKEVHVLLEDDTPLAVVCVSYQDFVPKITEELFGSNKPTVAVFYTIWSYGSGAAKELLSRSTDYIKNSRTTISRFVTLSPKTQMAEKFHMGNGAVLLENNADTVNYEYL